MKKFSDESIREVLIDLLDNYPALRKDEKKLVWCVWVKMGFVNEYTMTYNGYREAPLESTVLRIKRILFVDHPIYKFSDKVYAPRTRTNS